MRKKFDLSEIKKISNSDFLQLSAIKQGFLICDSFLELERNWKDSTTRDQLSRRLTEFFSQTKLEPASNLALISEPLRTACREDHLRDFISLVVPFERALGSSEQVDSIIIDRCDRDVPLLEKSLKPLFVIADNLRSVLNIGGLFRTCECLQISHLYLCGYSATPENQKLARSAMGTEQLVPWSWHPNAKNAIDLVQEKGIPVYALETVAKSMSIYDYQFPSACGLLIGNERYGLSPELLEYCATSVKIPMFGRKNSLNVTNAFAIAASEILRQQGSFKC